MKAQPQVEVVADNKDSAWAFFAFSTVVYDSIVSGKMYNLFKAPQYRICKTYPRLTGNTLSAAEKVLFHSCISLVKIFYAWMHVISGIISLAAVSDSICNINEYENEFADMFEERCRYKLSSALHSE